MILFIIILLIIIEATFDGIRYRYERRIGKYSGELYHILKALFVLVFLIFGYILNNLEHNINIIYLITGYTLLRFGIFDFIYNTLIGQYYLYIGNTSIFDKFMRKIFNSATAKMFYYLIKGISIILGMYIIQYKLF